MSRKTKALTTPSGTRRSKKERQPNGESQVAAGGELHQAVSGHHVALTTNQGVALSNNQNSLKANPRGPVLLEDFILREKITHFDHGRIPERIVHARATGVHGYFELTSSLKKYTTARILTEVGEKTPVFTRISTVAGGAGSVDTPRDVRGFAVKFYTREGNWDLVGNDIPVFFIQDAIKFPDLIHAVKMEPDRGFPQSATAHDTFWDFISLTPESMHMVMWIMSDRTLPRSLRMIEGFGIHSFRLINDAGESTFVKFHWRPKLGLQSTIWDETVKISGADQDFHRRDMFDAIAAGDFPEWEFAVQLFTQEEADDFPFDHLDATKLIPEELVPLKVIGRMVLDRWPNNFFAETEQVAYCPSHIVPGIDFSNDPPFVLLSGHAAFTPWVAGGGNLACAAQGPGCGVAFKLSPSDSGDWTYARLLTFQPGPTGSGGPGGAYPYSGLIFDSAGNLWGTTIAGGSAPDYPGVVFKLSSNATGKWTERVVHGFSRFTAGLAPYSGVVFDPAGKLFGTTAGGGAPNRCTFYGTPGGCGLVFEITP